MKLWKHQNQLIHSTNIAFQDSRAVLLQLATGGGKTVIAGKMAMDLHSQLLDRRGGVVLFLVHRKELIKQAAKTLRKMGLGNEFGIIASGHPETPWKPIQIASVFTLIRRLDAVRSWFRPKLVFVDEAHHIRAETWERVLIEFAGSYLCGLTATPARLDGKGLGKFFDRMVEGPTVKHLMDAGILCRLKNYSLDTGLNMAGVPKAMGEYNKKEADKRITPQVIASGITNFLKYASDRHPIFYANNIRHSKQFVQQVLDAGYRAEHVDGTTPPDERDKIIERYESGETQLLSNVGIVTEGFDCPSCDCVILGWLTASMVFYKQAVGRTMRKKPEDYIHQDGMVLDLAGNMDAHGDPEDDVEWTLENGVIKSATLMSSPDGCRTCKDCGYRYPRKMADCPMCGADNSMPTPEEIEAELTERKGGNGKHHPKVDRKTLNSMVFKTWGDEDKLREIQQTYGYKPGVIHTWKRIYGRTWGMRNRPR